MQTPGSAPPPADAAANVPSLRTLGTGSTQAAAGNVLGTGTLALTSTSANVITSATTDVNTSAAVAAMTLKNTVALTAGDLQFDFQKSDATSLLKITEASTSIAGNFYLPSINIQMTGNGIYAPAFRGLSASYSATVLGDMVDGASAIGVVLRTGTAWADAASKLVSIQNATVEKAYVDKDGYYNGGVNGLGGVQTSALATPVNGTHTSSVTGFADLIDGTYWYRVSATNAAGETLASTETSIVVASGEAINRVTVKWLVVPGATGYKVYGRTTGAETLLNGGIVTSGTTLSFYDMGSTTAPTGTAPPTANTTGGLHLGGTNANVITTATTDANTSATVAALTIRPTTVLGSGDLLFDIQKSTGYSKFSVNDQGDINATGILTSVGLACNNGLLDFTSSFPVVIRTNASDANVNTSDAAIAFWVENAVTSGDLLFNFEKVGHVSVLKITDTTASIGVPTLALAGTGANVITSATTDANTSSTVAALTLKSAVALTAGDLVLNVTNSADTSLMKVDTAGLVTAASGVVVGAAGLKFSDTTTMTTAPVTGGWVTAMDLDLSAEATQALATDTTYTIGGKTWTKINSANDATAAAITNGQGLVLTPVAATDLNAGTKTLPGITLPLTSISASLNWSTPLRFLFYVSSSNSAANYDAAVVAVWNSTLNSYHTVKMLGYYGGAKTFLHQRSWAGSGSSFYGITAFANSNVCCIEFPQGLQPLHVSHLAGTYAAGFPAITALSPTYNHWPGSDYIQVDTVLGAFSDWKILLGAQRAGSGTSYVAKFARVLVQYKL